MYTFLLYSVKFHKWINRWLTNNQPVDYDMIDNEEEKPVDSQAELRRRIMVIQSNPALSPSEKAKQVQVS